MHVGTVGKSNPPRGSVLVIVLVSLLVASLLGAGLVRTVLIHQRQMRVQGGQQQGFWLAEAAVQRAALRLSESADYRGETWKVPAEVLGASRTAEVTIEVAKPGGEPEARLIRVRAVIDQGRSASCGYQCEHRLLMPSRQGGEETSQSKAQVEPADSAAPSQP